MIYERYEIFDQFPNWASRVRFTYAMATTVAATLRYKEQRKAKKDVSSRSITFSLLLDYRSPEIFNYIVACLQRVMYLPLFNEQIICKSDGSDLSTIATGSGNQSLFNLVNRCELVAIANLNPPKWDDQTDEDYTVVTSLSSFTDDSITVAPVTFTYEKDNVAIFPVMLASLSSIRKIDLSASLNEYELTFNEFIEEGA